MNSLTMAPPPMPAHLKTPTLRLLIDSVSDVVQVTFPTYLMDRAKKFLHIKPILPANGLVKFDDELGSLFVAQEDGDGNSMLRFTEREARLDLCSKMHDGLYDLAENSDGSFSATWRYAPSAPPPPPVKIQIDDAEFAIDPACKGQLIKLLTQFEMRHPVVQ